MSVNAYQPHLHILPEDAANRQLADGFLLEVDDIRRVRILREAGGWKHVLDDFLSDHVTAMRRFLYRNILMLVDFDEKEGRGAGILDRVPTDVSPRVFVLGVWSEPEVLRSALHVSYQDLGRRLAVECREGRSDLWSNTLLSHNGRELKRLTEQVRPLLFNS